MITVKLKIKYQTDRDRLISALANSGYKVWIVEETRGWRGKIYYVNFEIEED